MSLEEFSTTTKLAERGGLERALFVLYWLSCYQQQRSAKIKQVVDLMVSLGLPRAHGTKLRRALAASRDTFQVTPGSFSLQHSKIAKIDSELGATVTDTSISAKIKSASTEPNYLFDHFVEDQGLRRISRKLFFDGHYGPAVFEAFKYVDNQVKKRSGLRGSGDRLMRTAFSVNAPILKINDGLSESDADEQQGYMDIFAGAMKGIRNPRAHDDDRRDDASKALKLLIMAQHLCDVLAGSKGP